MFKRLLLVTFFTGLLQAQIGSTLKELTHSLNELITTLVRQNPTLQPIKKYSVPEFYPIVLEVYVEDPKKILGTSNVGGGWWRFAEIKIFSEESIANLSNSLTAFFKEVIPKADQVWAVNASSDNLELDMKLSFGKNIAPILEQKLKETYGPKTSIVYFTHLLKKLTIKDDMTDVKALNANPVKPAVGDQLLAKIYHTTNTDQMPYLTLKLNQ